MYTLLSETIKALEKDLALTAQRKAVLQPLITYIQQKINQNKQINLNFICTHNSRRSHFAQIWTQTIAYYFNIQNVNCFSGGTEETALYPKVAETLANQGFYIFKIATGNNPIYGIKLGDNILPLVGFSKKYDHPFNPITDFAAVMTCSQADGACPFIAGAEQRIPITFDDPKISDNTSEQTPIYLARSREIASEMVYVFSNLKK